MHQEQCYNKVMLLWSHSLHAAELNLGSASPAQAYQNLHYNKQYYTKLRCTHTHARACTHTHTHTVKLSSCFCSASSEWGFHSDHSAFYLSWFNWIQPSNLHGKLPAFARTDQSTSLTGRRHSNSDNPTDTPTCMRFIGWKHVIIHHHSVDGKLNVYLQANTYRHHQHPFHIFQIHLSRMSLTASLAIWLHADFQWNAIKMYSLSPTTQSIVFKVAKKVVKWLRWSRRPLQ